jgi:hypothetical protein
MSTENEDQKNEMVRSEVNAIRQPID